MAARRQGHHGDQGEENAVLPLLLGHELVEAVGLVVRAVASPACAGGSRWRIHATGAYFLSIEASTVVDVIMELVTTVL